jgi:hypothetical protein
MGKKKSHEIIIGKKKLNIHVRASLADPAKEPKIG